MQHPVNALSHDRRTGLIRGQPGPLLYMTEAEPPDNPEDKTRAEEQRKTNIFNTVHGTVDIQTQISGNQHQYSVDNAQ